MRAVTSCVRSAAPSAAPTTGVSARATPGALRRKSATRCRCRSASAVTVAAPGGKRTGSMRGSSTSSAPFRNRPPIARNGLVTRLVSAFFSPAQIALPRLNSGEPSLPWTGTENARSPRASVATATISPRGSPIFWSASVAARSRSTPSRWMLRSFFASSWSPTIR